MIAMMLATGVAIAAATAQETELLPRPSAEWRVARQQQNTLFGPSGLIVTPNAYTAGVSQVNFGTSFGEDVHTISANWGIFKDIEVGAAFIDRDGASNKVIGSAKIKITPANFRNFDIGIGIIDPFDAINQTAYIVGSAYITPGTLIEQSPHATALRLHMGVGTGIFQERLFGGAEVILDDRFALAAEYDSENLNASLRYSYDENLRAQLGFQNTDIFFGMTYGLRF
jgi:hypothetical protein